MKNSRFYNPQGGDLRNQDDLSYRTKEFIRGNLPRVYFRGQSNFKWELIPSSGRQYSFVGKTVGGLSLIQERNFLHRFRRRVYAYYNRTLNDWEAFLLARHHGLPVRLLDWTTNPLVALYNACCFEKDPECDGAVWAFLPTDQAPENYLDVFKEQRSPLEIKGVRIIYPFDVSPRLTVQSSIFTIQQDPLKGLQSYDPIAFPETDFDIKKIIKWRVPKQCKAHLIVGLDRNGINARTLYPDLDGLARGILQTEIVHYGTPVKKKRRLS